jgi:5,10-methylenetetrahydromethanopterin reductase
VVEAVSGGGRGGHAGGDVLAGVPMALYVQDAHPIREAMAFVQRAEELGFAAVWQADSRLVREATVPMAAFAATTSRIAVGSGVIDIWSRNPARLASVLSTLDDLAPGRVLAGLGAWWDPLAAKVGITRDRPLRVMREVVEAVRALLRCDGPVTYDGVHVHLDGVELDYVHQERRAKEVPVYVGATGMQMMALAGEIADGAVLNYLVSPAYNERALAALAEGADRAGRTLDDVDRPQLVVCSLDDDRERALDRARELVTQYLGQQPHIGKASGVDQSLLDDIAEELTWPATPEQIRKAMALVPDEVVQMLTASGTADECRAKVREYVASGCTSPILYPLGDDVDAMLEEFQGGWS